MKGHAGAYPGWIAQSMVAIKTLFDEECDSIDFEIIDDVGFKKDDEYYIVQVKHDTSGALTKEKIKNEIEKMRKKGMDIDNAKFRFIISTIHYNKIQNIVGELIAEHRDIHFIVYEDLVKETMLSIKNKIKNIDIDETVAHIAACFIGEIVFNAYYKKDVVKIVIKKSKIMELFQKLSWNSIVDLIFDLETETLISSNLIDESEITKFEDFDKKFKPFLEKSKYSEIYSQYDWFKNKSIEKQLIQCKYFESLEKNSVTDYLFDNPSNIEKLKEFWKNNIKNDIFFVPKKANMEKRVNKIIRRGVLIHGIEKDISNTW